jgi:hypothetical protein
MNPEENQPPLEPLPPKPETPEEATPNALPEIPRIDPDPILPPPLEAAPLIPESHPIVPEFPTAPATEAVAPAVPESLPAATVSETPQPAFPETPAPADSPEPSEEADAGEADMVEPFLNIPQAANIVPVIASPYIIHPILHSHAAPTPAPVSSPEPSSPQLPPEPHSISDFPQAPLVTKIPKTSPITLPEPEPEPLPEALGQPLPDSDATPFTHLQAPASAPETAPPPEEPPQKNPPRSGIPLFLCLLVAILCGGGLITLFQNWPLDENFTTIREADDWTVFLGRFHPIILHLPVGILGFVAFFDLLTLGKARQKIRPGITGGLWLAAFGSVAATASGWLLAQEGGYAPSLLKPHFQFAILITAGVFLTLFLQLLATKLASGFVGFLQKLALLGTLAALGLGAHEGGSLSHGEGFLTDRMPAQLRELLPVSLRPEIPEKKPAPPVAVTDESVVFTSIILPILENKCNECHSPAKTKGKLRMHTFEDLMKGGGSDDIAAIAPGNPKESLVLERILLPIEQEEHMPPEDKPQMTDEETYLLTWWIQSGASATATLAESKPSAEVEAAITSWIKVTAEEKKSPGEEPAIKEEPPATEPEPAIPSPEAPVPSDPPTPTTPAPSPSDPQTEPSPPLPDPEPNPEPPPPPPPVPDAGLPPLQPSSN